MFFFFSNFFHTFLLALWFILQMLCKRKAKKENSHNPNNVVIGKDTREEKGWVFPFVWVVV